MAKTIQTKSTHKVKFRLSAAEFETTRPLLDNMSENRVDAARMVVVDGATMDAAALRYGLNSRQAVELCIRTVRKAHGKLVQCLATTPGNIDAVGRTAYVETARLNAALKKKKCNNGAGQPAVALYASCLPGNFSQPGDAKAAIDGQLQRLALYAVGHKMRVAKAARESIDDEYGLFCRHPMLLDLLCDRSIDAVLIEKTDARLLPPWIAHVEAALVANGRRLIVVGDDGCEACVVAQPVSDGSIEGNIEFDGEVAC